MNKSPLLYALLLPLSSCVFGPDFTGSWEGTCEASSSGYTAVYKLEIDIDDDSGGEIQGNGNMTFDGYTVAGDVDGSTDGDNAEIVLELIHSGYKLEVELDGILNGDTIKGDCTLMASGYYIDGEFKLKR